MRKHSRFIATFVSSVVLGLLSYSFVISIGLPAKQRAAPLATIATGIALSAVAALAYLLQRRSLELQCQSFDALHVPSLGIHYKNPVMYPSTVVVPAEEVTDVYAEYIMWNAGDVPILVRQPWPALPPGPGPVDPSKERVELERVRGDKVVYEESFPIVLGKGEACIWRQFTGDVAPFRPMMSEVLSVHREETVDFLRNQKGNRRFLFEVGYSSKPPATLTQSDTYKQYVGFAYQASSGEGDGRGEAE